MKKLSFSNVLGIIIIFVGIIFLGNNFEFWKVNIFFDGWWTLFIIVPSMINVFKGKNIISSLLIFLIGILLLFVSLDIIMWGFLGKIMIPIVLVMIGLCIVLKPDLKKIKITKEKPSAKNPNYVGIFGGCSEKVNYKINDSNCVSIFGAVDLDLTKAIINQDITIETISVFGGIEIKVPKNVDVKANGVAIFGGTEDNVKNDVDDKSPTIHINYTCIFGSIEIK